MAELEQQVQQLEREVRELQAMLKTDRERIDRLTNRVNMVAPESHGPSAEDIHLRPRDNRRRGPGRAPDLTT
jgi:predicted RNase H-like nuclease (RuvC/YqgF family)